MEWARFTESLKSEYAEMADRDHFSVLVVLILAISYLAYRTLKMSHLRFLFAPPVLLLPEFQTPKIGYHACRIPGDFDEEHPDITVAVFQKAVSRPPASAGSVSLAGKPPTVNHPDVRPSAPGTTANYDLQEEIIRKLRQRLVEESRGRQDSLESQRAMRLQLASARDELKETKANCVQLKEDAVASENALRKQIKSLQASATSSSTKYDDKPPAVSRFDRQKHLSQKRTTRLHRQKTTADAVVSKKDLEPDQRELRLTKDELDKAKAADTLLLSQRDESNQEAQRCRDRLDTLVKQCETWQTQYIRWAQQQAQQWVEQQIQEHKQQQVQEQTRLAQQQAQLAEQQREQATRVHQAQLQEHMQAATAEIERLKFDNVRLLAISLQQLSLDDTPALVAGAQSSGPDVKNLQKEIQRLNEANSRRLTESRRLISDLQTRDQQNTHLEGQSSKLENDNAQKDERIATLQAEVKELFEYKTANQTHTGQIDALEQSKEHLKHEMQAIIDSLQHGNLVQADMVKNTVRERDDAVYDLQKAQEEIERAQRRTMLLEGQYNAVEAERQRLETELAPLKQKESQLMDVTSATAVLQEKVDNLDQSLRQERVTRAAAEGRLDQSNKKIAGLQKDITRLTGEKQNLEQASSRLMRPEAHRFQMRKLGADLKAEHDRTVQAKDAEISQLNNQLDDSHMTFVHANERAAALEERLTGVSRAPSPLIFQDDDNHSALEAMTRELEELRVKYEATAATSAVQQQEIQDLNHKVVTTEQRGKDMGEAFQLTKQSLNDKLNSAMTDAREARRQAGILEPVPPYEPLQGSKRGAGDDDDDDDDDDDLAGRVVAAPKRRGMIERTGKQAANE